MYLSMTKTPDHPLIYNLDELDKLPLLTLIEDYDGEHYIKTYGVNYHPDTGFDTFHIWRNVVTGDAEDQNTFQTPIWVLYAR